MENEGIGLKNELFYFIRRFIFDNIQFGKFGITTWKPLNTDYSNVDDLWEPDEDFRKQTPQVRDPFTEDEKCSLFFMLSHSVIEAAKSVAQPSYGQRSASNLMKIQRSYTNATFDNIPRTTTNIDELYPQEQGVVAILGSETAVSLGRVITGIYVGLNENRNRRRNLDSFSKIQKNPPPNALPADQMVDPLYSLTIAEILTIAGWKFEEKDMLSPNGKWKSTSTKQDDEVVAKICPMIYKLDSADSAYTYSSVRGAADGLILGKISSNLVKGNRDIRLSQLLRMYYSRGGIVEKSEDQTEIRASFCLRAANMEKLEETLNQQILLFEYLVSSNYAQLDEIHRDSWKYYTELKNEIYRASEEIKNYCDAPVGLDKPENLPLETPLDVVVVLDSSAGEETFRQQQIIIGHVAKQMDLRHSGSRMIVLKDVRLPTNGADGKIELETAINETYSSSCAACEILQITPSSRGSIASRDQVIFAIDQFLEERKKNETRFHGAAGKVVIYFNFDEDIQVSQGNKDYQRLLTALKNFHLHHQDAAFFAVGRNSEVLQRFAKQDIAFVMTVAEGSDETIGNNLYKKIIQAPARLQYTDCEEAKSENTAVFDYFVSPNVIQHWEIPAEYLYKSRGMKFFFESQYGSIRVCHNRANRSPELRASNCQDVITNKLELKDSNPCQSATVTTCSPYFFSVIGINSTDEKSRGFCVDNRDAKCRTLDQIKFKFSHEGLRCSGSINVVAVPAILLLGLLISRMFSQHS
ncbi:uncharacterized protein LOC129222415 [Uloborus diversus]|uniref:uncharacterized protein LOC129222415 n=1 Tax=Uloborus diversus TaxID=327109 RepID=UPI002409D0BB|nr:uncharacterized protein LOC129222415 [Uloborus diversus]